MLGVTRVVLVRVILRHGHDPLPDILVEKLPHIVEVSLFKREHPNSKTTSDMEKTQYRPGRREAAGMARDYSHGLGPGAALTTWQLTATMRDAKLMHGRTGARPRTNKSLGGSGYEFAWRAIEAGHPEPAAAAVICFEWLQRPENVLAGCITWSDYRGKNAPTAIKVEHH